MGAKEKIITLERNLASFPKDTVVPCYCFYSFVSASEFNIARMHFFIYMHGRVHFCLSLITFFVFVLSYTVSINNYSYKLDSKLRCQQLC